MVCISMFWMNFFARFADRENAVSRFMARGAYAAYVIHPAIMVPLCWTVWLVCDIGNPWPHPWPFWYNKDGYPDGSGTTWQRDGWGLWLAFLYLVAVGCTLTWLAAGKLVQVERLKGII